MARRNKRERNFIAKLLAENEKMCTGEILEAVNNQYAWGFTTFQLGNVLSKDDRFIKLDEVARVASLAGDGTTTSAQAMWALRDDD